MIDVESVGKAVIVRERNGGRTSTGILLQQTYDWFFALDMGDGTADMFLSDEWTVERLDGGGEMSRYTDEKNLFSCTLWDEAANLTSHDAEILLAKAKGFEVGYLAAEKERDLTGDERDLFLFLAEYAPDYIIDESFESLKKKVLGE